MQLEIKNRLVSPVTRAFFITPLQTYDTLCFRTRWIIAFSLNGRVWFYIFLASIAWTLLGLQAYIMALTFKIAIVPLLFLLPQVYNLGTFLANYISTAKFLPVILGQGLIATSPQILGHNSLQNILLYFVGTSHSWL